MSIDLLARAEGLRSRRTPFVLATVIRAERPTSARPGDRAIVLGDGEIEGFVGGACATSTLRVQSAELLRTGGTTLLRITPAGEPDGPAAPDRAPAGLVVVDNPCLSGGSLEILLEAVMPPALVQVFGESPIARSLAQVGAAAGFEVRAGGDPAVVVEPGAVAVVVASHGHDEPAVLRAALAAGTPYVALVASPKRGAAVRAELALSPAEQERLSTPAGLDIGARTPGEIAVSILAELISRQVRAPVPGPAGPVAATDPVCGMAVAVAPATLHHVHSGHTWYFCSGGCRQSFAADPARYGA